MYLVIQKCQEVQKSAKYYEFMVFGVIDGIINYFIFILWFILGNLFGDKYFLVVYISIIDIAFADKQFQH